MCARMVAGRWAAEMTCPVCKAEGGVLEKKNETIQLGTNIVNLVFDGTFIVDILFLN